MNNKYKSVIVAIQISFVVLTAIFIAYHIIDKIRFDRDFGFESNYTEIENWTWVQQDGTEVQVTLPIKLDIDKGSPATLYTTLPDDVESIMGETRFRIALSDLTENRPAAPET